jgi:pSer/pThr/pTyr-binding forkhead associated (FHA) protein
MKQMAQLAAESKGWPILEPINVEELPRPVAINKDVCVVGTRQEVNLKLASPLVSRTHAIFVADHDSIYLRDLASRNHTYLNDKPIREAVLRNGDTIGLGPLAFRCKSGFDKPYDPTEMHAPAAELLSVTDGKRIPLTMRSTLIGSRDDCDVVLPARGVEPSHAIIFEREGRRYIRDLRSVSGTWVNNNAVGQIELNDGDDIRIAQAEFVYQFTHEKPLEQEAERPVATQPASATAESLVGDDDEQVELELADDTREGIPESVGLSDWDTADLLSEPQRSPAAGEAVPIAQDSVANTAVATEPAESTPLPADQDVIPIRLEDLADRAETPVEPQVGSASADAIPTASPVTADAEDDVSLEPGLDELMGIASELPLGGGAEPEDLSTAEDAPVGSVPLASPTVPVQSVPSDEPARLDLESESPALQSAHPGQHNRPAPEEKLTDLLDHLVEEVAEVQSTWKEVRANKQADPHGAQPGSQDLRNDREHGKRSDDPSVRPHGSERAHAGPNDAPASNRNE